MTLKVRAEYLSTKIILVWLKIIINTLIKILLKVEYTIQISKKNKYVVSKHDLLE